MKLDVHVHFHSDGVVGRILDAIEQLSEKVTTMSDKLDQAIAENNAATEVELGQLASIKTFLEGLPALVSAAVADALAAANVADDAAAEQIDIARNKVSAAVSDTLDAISANPEPAP